MRVLAKIDGALTEYGYIENDGGGMRWRPEEPEEPERTVCEDDEGDWPDPDGDTWGPFTVRVHFRVPGKGWNVCVKAEARSAREMPGMAASMRRTYAKTRGWYPRPASHCDDCNPRGNPGALAVNGHEYNRHRKARQGRKSRLR